MKTKMFRRLTLAMLCILAMGALASADTLPTLTLDPADGAITGAPGSTVGWGFTLTNLGSDWAVVTSSDFCVGPITSPCINSFGTYTDFAGPQFILVGPSPESTVFTQAFDNSLQQGMGSFFINPSSVGTVFGQIALTYDLFNVDPFSENFDPSQDTVSVGNYLMAPASVTAASSTVPTPEPGTLLLVLAGSTVFFLFARKLYA
jgi:hypothetical protein